MSGCLLFPQVGKFEGTGKKFLSFPIFNTNCMTGPDIPGEIAVLRASHNQYPINVNELISKCHNFVKRHY